MQRLQAWLSASWFPDVLIGLLFGSVLLLALLLEPSPQVVSLFGWDVPELCGLRRTFGVECIGCGLTRSFSFMARGSFNEAFSMNKLGPILFVLFATQPPYRLFVVAKRTLSKE